MFRMCPTPDSLLACAGSQGKDAHEIHYGFELSDDEIRRIKETTAILWFYIALIYTDVMNREHEARFCWRHGQENPAADQMIYFFDDGSAPAAYTRKT